MHPHEVDTSNEVARRLVAGQFPQWAALPLSLVSTPESSGTDNTIYRLGERMAVRLPRRPSAGGQVEREAQWLPQLAPQLSLPIHVPLEVGAPAEGYPFTWGVYSWLDGVQARLEMLRDEREAARDLAAFVRSLQRIDASDGPRAGAANFGRGLPLATRDASTQTALAQAVGLIDVPAASEAWDSALAAPVWSGPGVWLHADLSSFNLLAVDGRLTGVIDFGCMGVGDPACELLPAWNIFGADGRAAYREALEVDEATWRRGRGWALSVALLQLPYYLETNVPLAESARRTIAAVLADED